MPCGYWRSVASGWSNKTPLVLLKAGLLVSTVMAASRVQFLNASKPILVTLAGRAMLVMVAQEANGVGNHNTGSLAAGTFNQRGLIPVEQNASRAAVSGVGGIHVDGSQVGAGDERLATDADDAGGEEEVGQFVAGLKSVGADGDDASAKVDVGHIKAEVERRNADVRDAVRNSDARQPAISLLTVIERFVPDAGDRITVGGGGDDHIIAGAGITRDGDGVVVGYEVELGRRGEGERHEQQNYQQPLGAM
jgi:hypothetical protein